MKIFFLTLIITASFTGEVSSQSGWVHQSSGTTFNLNRSHFININTGWIVGDSGTILKTVDGGQNWITQNSGTLRNLYFLAFTDANNGFAAGNYYQYSPLCHGHAIRLRTTNGGQNWIIIQEGPATDFTSVTTSNDIIYMSVFGIDMSCFGTSGAVARSDNGGLNFGNLNIPGAAGGFMSVNFINENTGWTTSYGDTDFGLRFTTIWRTTNNGMSWNRMYHDSVSNGYGVRVYEKLDFTDLENGYSIRNFSVYKTINSGSNWFVTNDSLSNIDDVKFFNSQTGWSCGGNGRIYRTDDGGNDWVIQQTNTASFLKDLSIINNYIGYAIGTNGMILKTITGGLTGVSGNENFAPSQFSLKQNYPNPFNPNTTINYEMKAKGFVKIKVYDIRGNEVASLINNEQTEGSHQTEFDGSDLASGVYYYRLEVDGVVRDVKRMTLVK